MPLEKRIKHVSLFDNGNLVVFDEAGEQIGELQGEYSLEKHRRILLEAMPDCEFCGLIILPHGFRKAAFDWADHFKKQNLSWEEIQNL